MDKIIKRVYVYAYIQIYVLLRACDGVYVMALCVYMACDDITVSDDR